MANGYSTSNRYSGNIGNFSSRPSPELNEANTEVPSLDSEFPENFETITLEKKNIW